MNLTTRKISIIVPTLNPGKENWIRWIDAINCQTAEIHRVLVIDSSSDDDTVSISKEFGLDTHTIKRQEFNHGKTRQLGAELCQDSDILVYLTQDSILASPDSISEIIKPFEDKLVGAVCGRQLPHANANILAKHSRLYNYGPTPKTNSLQSEHLSIKTVFMSNSFAAYSKDILKKIGGFPSNTIVCEDMYVAAKILMANFKVSYSSSATTYHSHNYTIADEFKRYFDIGVFHARESWIRESFSNESKAGIRYAVSELQYAWKKEKSFILLSAVSSLSKYLAFKLGLNENALPTSIKRILSMHSEFWSDHHVHSELTRENPGE
ncbi:glycosyltransferase family 2 protein [Ketobacter sp.]|uniref:glycosyltransferase family 2 protein n=1 Tax=Ketobacter sp. TaxID=2083498 RepID=UPI000F209A05|nr:glycosyltransferase [Ketobacter sp.]RLT92294.1 MAG: glycosyltransferase [Ketobacter sp.]